MTRLLSKIDIARYLVFSGEIQIQADQRTVSQDLEQGRSFSFCTLPITDRYDHRDLFIVAFDDLGTPSFREPDQLAKIVLCFFHRVWHNAL